MRFLKTISVILTILILVPGVCSDEYGVTITNPAPCVTRGSSVDIGCSYEYPVGHTVTEAYWSFYYSEKAIVSKQLSFQGRIEYIGNKDHDCTLRIKDIKKSDMRVYLFETKGKRPKDEWRKNNTMYLSVTELSARMTPPTVSEGTWVTLTCETSCKSRPNIVWFKNGHRVSKPQFQAKIEDAGSYQCAIEGQETWKSEPVMLDVQYGPKNVTLFISPSYVLEGGSVTFTCNSDANPKVKPEQYTLFRDQRLVTLSQNHTISNIQKQHRGQYSCQAHNGINTTTSAPVPLEVQYVPKDVVLSVSPPGDVVIGSSVTFTCSSSGSYPPIQSYIFLKDNTEVTQKEILTISNIQHSHSGTYSCQAKNNFTTVNSPEVTLHVLSNSVALISGVGVLLVLVLILLFVIVFWVRKKKTNAEQECEQDVDYCSVTFKPEARTQADHNNTALQHTLSGEAGNEDSVIYSSVVKEDSSAIYATVNKTQRQSKANYTQSDAKQETATTMM